MKNVKYFHIFIFLSAFFLGCDFTTENEVTDLDIQAIEEVREEAGEAEINPNDAVEQAPPQNGSEQFLWKPASENDGRLVILLPSSLRGQVQSCTISGSFGTEKGRFAGDTHNGFRPHYRFRHPGSNYGTSITVIATLTNGETRTWFVPNGANRATH